MNLSRGNIVSVIGCGLIGRSWAMVFLSGGFRVKIFDSIPGQAARAVQEIRQQLEEVEQAQMLRGSLSVEEQLLVLSCHDELSQALEGAVFVQESVFEDLETKRSVFQEVERHVGEFTVLSSSTSCLMPSGVFSRVENRKRCIVSHPVNPPYFVRLVELVPHPETAAEVVDGTHALMTRLGQVPVRLRKEIDGFALNRVQYAIIAECWRLIAVRGGKGRGVYGLLTLSDERHALTSPKEGVISVQDIDLVMSEGLGMHYAFTGPMETIHLNAPEGLEDYLRRYREGMKRVLTSFGPVPEFSGEDAKSIHQEMCGLILNDHQHLSASRQRRDHLLIGLAKLKK
ncbi:hypothetical protein GJAV_G00254850 [Gymnothorax javanicus]|nr:hypothetical protein GJAV_G00254850 [Gymnothorax javanicus]